MNQECELAHALNNPDFLVIAGSRLYGTSTPESDYDYRGFVVPPFEYLAGLSNFDHHVIGEPDTVIYSIKRLFQLLILGDPVVYEILFAPERNIIERSDIGGIILRNRSLFACKRFAHRIGGYAKSAWRKVTGTKLVPVKRTPNEDEVIEDIREVFSPQKEEMDEIIRLLMIQHPRETRSARRKLGANRKAQIERYGYCTSSACHAIRLMGQLKELMLTGNITFPRPEAELLLDIKCGRLSLEEVTTINDKYTRLASEAENNTDLPDSAPIKQILSLYNEIIVHTIKSDPRAQKYSNDYEDHWG